MELQGPNSSSYLDQQAFSLTCRPHHLKKTEKGLAQAFATGSQGLKTSASVSQSEYESNSSSSSYNNLRMNRYFPHSTPAPVPSTEYNRLLTNLLLLSSC